MADRPPEGLPPGPGFSGAGPPTGAAPASTAPPKFVLPRTHPRSPDGVPSVGQRAHAYRVDTGRILLPTLATWAVLLLPMFIHLLRRPAVQDELATVQPDGSHGSLHVLAHGVTRLAILATILYWVVMAVYTAIHASRGDGRTPGQRVAGVHVIREDGRPITWRYAVYRSVLIREVLMGIPGIFTLGLFSFVQYGWAGRDPHGRTLHDLVARSRVVQDTAGQA